MNLYQDDDISAPVASLGRIAVVGYGNQGRAQALNLRDSGCNPAVGLRPDSETRNQVAEDGLEAMDISTAVEQSDLVACLIPDEVQASVWNSEIGPYLSPGATAVFAHGFNVHYDRLDVPDGVNVVLVAPLGPGALVRSRFVDGNGVPALMAVDDASDASARTTALTYAKAIGATRSGVLETTVAEETETDLFAEQAVLCGGVPAIMQAGFDTLVTAGYQPEIAYLSCVFEVKQIVDLIYYEGLEAMTERVSNTAEFGALKAGPRIAGESVLDSMRALLDEIQSGAFASNWINEFNDGLPELRELRNEARQRDIEEVEDRLKKTLLRGLDPGQS